MLKNNRSPRTFVSSTFKVTWDGTHWKLFSANDPLQLVFILSQKRPVVQTRSLCIAWGQNLVICLPKLAILLETSFEWWKNKRKICRRSSKQIPSKKALTNLRSHLTHWKSRERNICIGHLSEIALNYMHAPVSKPHQVSSHHSL